MADVYVKNPDGSVSKVETKQVAVDTFTLERWKVEYDSVLSELANFQKIMDNREQSLNDRKIYLETIKAELDKT